MSSFDWKALLKKTAPMIGTAIGGPFGALAGAAVASILPDDKKADPKDPAGVDAMLQTVVADPAMLEKLKEAELNFQMQMAKLGFDHADAIERFNLENAKLSVDDRASARVREQEVRDRTPRILAYTYTLGFFMVLASEIVIGIKGWHIDPLVAKSIDILLGVLTGMVLGTKEYYFGQSSSDNRKTDLLAKAPPVEP